MGDLSMCELSRDAEADCRLASSDLEVEEKYCAFAPSLPASRYGY